MECIMNKKYIVRLTDAERRELIEVINKLKDPSGKNIDRKLWII